MLCLNTIQNVVGSQTVGLREPAAERGLLIVEDLVFEDEWFSGATLTRPAPERLRDRAGEGAFEVLLCHAPDRLARREAYRVQLLEELARAGVEVCFAKEPERGNQPPSTYVAHVRAARPLASRTRALRSRGASQR